MWYNSCRRVMIVSKGMSSVRYKRLMKVIALLQSKRKVSRNELEEAGEYTLASDKEGYRQNRTLQNDLHFLKEETGAEIEYDYHDKAYVLKHEGSLLVNITVTESEIEALSAGLKIAAHFLPHLEDDSESLWQKLTAYIPADLAGHGHSLAEATLAAIPVEPVKPEVFSLLTQAKNDRKAVRITYSSPGKDARVWTLSPYDFYFRGNAWYMISFNHKHQALSTHRISRIKRAVYSDAEYVMPEEGGFTEEYTASAWYVSPGTERHRVRLRLTGRLAESMSAVKWHPTQTTEWQPDGSVILTAEVPHLEELARWILAGAPNAEVLEPPALKYIVRDLALSVIDEL